MENQVYSDEIGAIAIQGPIVRFDLLVQSASEQDASGKPKLVLQQRVIMPIDGFLRATARLQGVVQDLEKKGLVTRAPRKDSGKGATSDNNEPLV